MADITNITLNGTNYTLKASGGSGEQVVELTQAQYDALTEYAEDTTYIITDATPINMDDYATTADTSAISQSVSAISGDVATISGNVSTLSGSVANKADKANVTARSSNYYIPRWNSQGIITGDTSAYPVSFWINGSSNNYLLKTTQANLPNIFAPTSAGTQNTILMSNGSGAPGWSSVKFQFISQAAYDALTTKDANTIYFITSQS